MQETQTAKKYNGPKLFVGGLSPATTPHSLRTYFERICPVQVVKVEFSRKSKNKKGFGYVIIDRQEDVEMLLRMNHMIDNKFVQVMPYSLEATTKWYKDKAQSIKIKLRNVPNGVSDYQISLFFERFARVLVVNVLQELSNEYEDVENVAYVELHNIYKPLLIGKKILTFNPNVTQVLNFFSIEKCIGGLSGSYSAPLIQSYSFESDNQTYSKKNIKSLLNFNEANQNDMHSKYEFIRARNLENNETSNYRFNLRVSSRISAGVRLLARRVSSPAIPTGTSLVYHKE